MMRTFQEDDAPVNHGGANYYGGSYGLGGAIAPAPTEQGVPGPPSILPFRDPNTLPGLPGPILILPPPGGGMPPGPPPIVPGMTQPGGVPSPCNECRHNASPVSATPAPMPTPTLGRQAAALDAGVPTTAARPVTMAGFPWWVLLVAAGVGYALRER